MSTEERIGEIERSLALLHIAMAMMLACSVGSLAVVLSGVML